MQKKHNFTLTDHQRAVIDVLADSPLREKFYWTGGTALAYFYLRHRLSFDVDLFSSEKAELSQVLSVIREIARRCGLKKIEQKKIHDRWEFLLTNGTQTRVEFVFYDFPRLKAPRNWQGVRVDSLDDMAANKTMALIERHEPKDIIDIYYLLTRRHYTVRRLLSLAHRKFGVVPSPYVFWSEALRAAKNLSKIRPLLFGNIAEQEEQIATIVRFAEKKAALFIKKSLG